MDDKNNSSIPSAICHKYADHCGAGGYCADCPATQPAEPAPASCHWKDCPHGAECVHAVDRAQGVGLTDEPTTPMIEAALASARAGGYNIDRPTMREMLTRAILARQTAPKDDEREFLTTLKGAANEATDEWIAGFVRQHFKVHTAPDLERARTEGRITLTGVLPEQHTVCVAPTVDSVPQEQAVSRAAVPEGLVLEPGQILALERRSDMSDDEALRFGRSVEKLVLLASVTAPASPQEGKAVEGGQDAHDWLIKSAEGLEKAGFHQAAQIHRDAAAAIKKPAQQTSAQVDTEGDV